MVRLDPITFKCSTVIYGLTQLLYKNINIHYLSDLERDLSTLLSGKSNDSFWALLT